MEDMLGEAAPPVGTVDHKLRFETFACSFLSLVFGRVGHYFFLWPLLLNPSPMLEVSVAAPCGCEGESQQNPVAAPCGCEGESQQNPTLEREGKEGRMWSTSISISIYRPTL